VNLLVVARAGCLKAHSRSKDLCKSLSAAAVVWAAMVAIHPSTQSQPSAVELHKRLAALAVVVSSSIGTVRALVA
jgi:hypothetical protein